MYMVSTGSSMRNLPPWFGAMTSPTAFPNRKPITEEHRLWCMDNDVFTGKFTPDKFRETLNAYQKHANTCLFVAAPDVLGDAKATLDAFPKWAKEIKAYGYPVALVAQDGMKPNNMPNEADWLFIGGSTEWKLGPDVPPLITEAKRRGMKVHVGRVNSNQRIKRFQLLGADTADGTYHAFAGVAGMARALYALNEQPLWKGQP